MSRMNRPSVAYGRNPALINIANEPVVGNKAPTNSDTGDIGQLVINQSTNAVYMLTSYVAGSPIWTRLDSNPAPSGITWVTDAGLGPIALDANYGYHLTNAGLIALQLPPNSDLGDVIYINTANSSAALAGVTIEIWPAQEIQFGNRSTSAGAGVKFLADHPGAVASGDLAISIILTCMVPNDVWSVTSINVVPNLI